MIATLERQHRARLPFIASHKTKLLPLAAIYGGNASGKSNLFKALSFSKSYIMDGAGIDAEIEVDPYRLQQNFESKPSSFLFVIYVDSKVYEYCFTLDKHKVFEEKLTQIELHSEDLLYRRLPEKIDLGSSLRGGSEEDLLLFVHKSTRPNQLFLTTSVSQNIALFKPIYDWFRHTLTLIEPEAHFVPLNMFYSEDHHQYPLTNKILKDLDTGIDSIKSEEMPLDETDIPGELKGHPELKKLNEGHMVGFTRPDGRSISFKREKGKLYSYGSQILTYHSGDDGRIIRFEMSDESDGTRRIINLLPAFLDVSSDAANRVYVIDELDRSLHTLLLRQLLESYLFGCNSETRSQMIFTTHDVMLMDQDYMRRDEMWVTERNIDGSTSLTSFSEFKDVRYDKDIRKSYLLGRLGGVPRILLRGALCKSAEESSESEELDGEEK